MSISKKLGFPLLLTAVGGFVAYSAFYVFLTRTRSDTAFMEVAGMEAIRAEHVGRLSYALVEGFEWAREPLDTAVSQFDADLVRLDEGGDVEGSVIDPIPDELRDAMADVRSSWEKVRTLATRILSAPLGDTSIAEHYTEMRPLLPELNEATLSLIQAAQLRTARLRRRTLVILGAICMLDLLLMIIGVMLIVRIVVRPIKSLESVALKVTEGDFSSTVPVLANDEIGSVSSSFNKMSASVQELLEREVEAASAIRLLSQKLLDVQETERRRLARELHDSTAQNIAAAAMRVDRIVASFGKSSADTLRHEAGEAQRLLREATDEVRTLSYVLHPPLLERLGFVPALRHFVEGFSERSGVAVSLEVESELEQEQLPDEVSLALFRVVQESLANIARHSESDRAEIRICRSQEDVAVEISDHGLGIPPEKLEAVSTGEGCGVGIAGMRERVALLGGTFKLSSTSSGARVDVRVPLPGPGDREDDGDGRSR